MEKMSRAELISYNIDNVAICASAARISTTKGNAVEIFEKAKDNEKNQELIQKVLRSGHKSIIEHVVFTIALKDVSAFVEQFFIECRLASFTVKSRRYVDFSKLGYYIPPDLEGESLDQYCKYMDGLFSAYNILLEKGVPKEDARFLLPYSFNSNFYCTLNARELTHIIYDIRCGRGKGIPELQDLANQIMQQVQNVFPCMHLETDEIPIEHASPEFSAGEIKVNDDISLIESGEIGRVSLLNKPSDPIKILNIAHNINNPDEINCLDLGMLLKSERPRELEQLSYTFLISNITLSGITHIVRHRMQSIIIPSILGIEHSKFIVPYTVKRDAKIFDIYKNVLQTSNRMMKQLSTDAKLRKYSYYYALSGNVMDIMTTMDARELMHFIKLRSCNRAQWEVRNISIEMLKNLRTSFSELFDYFGPSCFATGLCPEGNMTCGEMRAVAEKFKCLR